MYMSGREAESPGIRTTGTVVIDGCKPPSIHAGAGKGTFFHKNSMCAARRDGPAVKRVFVILAEDLCFFLSTYMVPYNYP